MSREKLQQYQEEDVYAFHGSASPDITELEPRQALSFQKPDGQPAVFVATSIEPAIFMAVLGSRKVAGWDSSKFTPPFGFYISASNWDKAQKEKWAGYVYVLNRQGFEKGSGWVWRSLKNVKPIDKVQVTFLDLPKEITVLDNEVETAYVKLYS